MNHAAIDQGVNAIVKINVPESWKTAEDKEAETKDVPEFISKILEPMNRQKGDDLPVSAFEGMEDGTFPRSEEHTSELQSRQYLVCRLLLEKKKKTKTTSHYS